MKFDGNKNEWNRLPYMAPLAKGEHYLSLPLFRPVVKLSTEISLQAEGAASFELAGLTDGGVPVVSIDYGRLIMLTIGKAGNTIEIAVGDRRAQLTFVSPELTLALEVRHVLAPGTDPEIAATPAAVNLYVTSGQIRVRDAETPVELEAPAQRIVFGSSEQPTSGDFPKWVTSEALPEIEHFAIGTIEPLLLVDRPVSLTLREVVPHRRREVRSLAIRSLCHLDSFEAAITALNDPAEKGDWSSYIEELRQPCAQPRNRRSSADHLRAPPALRWPALYRMLWGYSLDDLKSGADHDLVKGLSDDSLDFRELSIWNLMNITGLANFAYYPADLAANAVRA